MSASSDNARHCCVHFVFVIMKLGLQGFELVMEPFSFCCYYSNSKELVEFFYSASVFNFFSGKKLAKGDTIIF